MMDLDEFRKRGHELVDWMADYFQNVDSYPVRSQVAPDHTKSLIPPTPPQEQERFDTIFKDFTDIIMPGVTHWQHPKFMAYFNANNSYPSILAEMLTATLGTQCMIWQTSPAAAELEERVMEWTRELIGLPTNFTGVIQDTASTATLCSLLTARERITDFTINEEGLYDQKKLRVYCSTEAHSSIEKDVKIIGLGRENIRKIEVDNSFAMVPEDLDKAIVEDLEKGFKPLAVVAALGTTGSTAIDPLRLIGNICQRHGIWLHVDAAYAGTALILPEMRWMSEGMEKADSFVFNPHKWMFTNFDCSAYFVKDTDLLIRTFEILPEYLKTRERGEVNNYRDWGVQLGRRFRALKLWFVIRSFGVEGLQNKVRDHIEWAQELRKEIEKSPDFEPTAPTPLSTLCFRYAPFGIDNNERLNELNAILLDTLNDSGKLYLTHTKLNGVYTIRLVIGQTNQTRDHVFEAWELIQTTARKIQFHPENFQGEES